ncbi:MAG: hypothetical protein ACJAXY_001659 [Nonlabens sp.]
MQKGTVKKIKAIVENQRFFQQSEKLLFLGEVKVR